MLLFPWFFDKSLSPLLNFLFYFLSLTMVIVVVLVVVRRRGKNAGGMHVSEPGN